MYNWLTHIKQKYYTSFSKSAGPRLTEINIDSGSQLVNIEGIKELKIEPAFENQTLNIKNCILEVEFFLIDKKILTE